MGITCVNPRFHTADRVKSGMNTRNSSLCACMWWMGCKSDHFLTNTGDDAGSKEGEIHWCTWRWGHGYEATHQRNNMGRRSRELADACLSPPAADLRRSTTAQQHTEVEEQGGDIGHMSRFIALAVAPPHSQIVMYSALSKRSSSASLNDNTRKNLMRPNNWEKKNPDR